MILRWRWLYNSVASCHIIGSWPQLEHETNDITTCCSLHSCPIWVQGWVNNTALPTLDHAWWRVQASTLHTKKRMWTRAPTGTSHVRTVCPPICVPPRTQTGRRTARVQTWGMPVGVCLHAHFPVLFSGSYTTDRSIEPSQRYHKRWSCSTGIITSRVTSP